MVRRRKTRACGPLPRRKAKVSPHAGKSDPSPTPRRLPPWRHTKSRQPSPTALDHEGVGVQVVGEGGAGLSERCASTSSNGSGVHIECLEKRRSRIRREQARPGHGDIDRGVAHTCAAPVDQPTQCSVGDEAVLIEVSVYPDRGLIVRGRRQCLFPDGRGSLGVDELRCARDGPSRSLVVVAGRSSPTTGVWCTLGRDMSQCPDGCGEIEGEGDGISEVVKSSHSSRQPTVDRPRKGVALSRIPSRHRLGN